MRWRSRRNRRYNPRRHRRHNPLYKEAAFLDAAKELLDKITANASEVMGKNIDPLSDTILPEDPSIAATPLDIVTKLFTPPGASSHYHREVMKDLLTEEIAREPGKRYWDIVDKFENAKGGEYGDLEWTEDGRPRLPSSWTASREVVDEYGDIESRPSLVDGYEKKYPQYGTTREDFLGMFQQHPKSRRLRRRSKRFY